MSLISIAEAAKLVGKDRKTLYRMADKGRLSLTQNATGEKRVDVAELHRAFGTFATTCHSGTPVTMPQDETTNATGGDTEIRLRLAVAEAENAMLKERVVDLQNAMRLLEYSKPEPKSKPKRWWQF